MRACLFGLLLAGTLPAPAANLPSFATNRFHEHIRVLASDEFEGRAPGTRGEDLTIRYLTRQYAAMGLQPGGPGGSWEQPVPMVGLKSAVAVSLDRAGQAETLTFPQDFVAWSPRTNARVSVDASDVVFCGYGVKAPEYDWDDFKGVDVRGKTVVVLIGDPPVPDPRAADQLDPATFKGRAMTYYGRWTYKFEEAARRGAAAVFIVHETSPAGYPWFVTVNSWGRERCELVEDTAPKLDVAGWLSRERAVRVFAAAGHDFEKLKLAALRREFRPLPLPLRASLVSTQTVRSIQSRNVAAMLPGADPAVRDEWVVYTAHWDHLGRDPRLPGDQIYNGALDNATGSAGMLEIARAFAKGPRPRRSLLFLAVTAEEQGLLGARHYAAHPLHPLPRTLANLNLDGVNTRGRTFNVAVIGAGNSTLEDLLRAAAVGQDRTVEPEETPEKGYYYRSDHFEFARVGVPALYFKSGLRYRGRPPEWGRQQHDLYTDRDYHKVTDEIKPDWDFTGGMEDLQLLFAVGREVANGTRWPEWNAGAEFKSIRERSLRGGN